MIFYQKKAEIIQNNVPFFFFLPKSKNLLKFGLKNAFLVSETIHVNIPNFLALPKSENYQICPKCPNDRSQY